MPVQIEDILQKYFREAQDGYLIDVPPSNLKRGQGTDAEFYLLKIDLCASTQFVKNRHPRTYLKLAHVFLSTLDHICRFYNADGSQSEYAGDSVLSYFPANNATALDVLFAAYFCRKAAFSMRGLDSVLQHHPFKTRIVVHFGELIVANIGPWGDSRRTAIGPPLHVVGHLEKKVLPNAGIATAAFARKLAAVELRRYLAAEIEQASPQPSQQAEFQMGYDIPQSLLSALSPSNILFPPAQPLPTLPPVNLIPPVISKYRLIWKNIRSDAEGAAF